VKTVKYVLRGLTCWGAQSPGRHCGRRIARGIPPAQYRVRHGNSAVGAPLRNGAANKRESHRPDRTVTRFQS